VLLVLDNVAGIGQERWNTYAETTPCGFVLRDWDRTWRLGAWRLFAGNDRTP